MPFKTVTLLTMSSFSSTFNGAELDFRFADEMDVQDLEELIETYLLPLEQLTTIGGGGGFRNPESPIITAAEVSDIVLISITLLRIDSLLCYSSYLSRILSWRGTWIA